MTARLHVALTAVAVVLASGPAAAQSMSGMSMPGTDMSKPKPAKKAIKRPVTKRATPKKTASPAKPRPNAPTAMPLPDEHAAMPGMPMPATGGHAGMSAMPDTDMGPHAHGDIAGMAIARATPNGTDLPAGHASPPPPPADHYADRTFPTTAMRPARAMFRHENGGMAFSQVMFNLAEAQFRQGRDGYRWDGEGWFGGDYSRFVVKSEGEGAFGKGVDAAEAQALYSRAIGPYFDLQAGIRHDFKPSPTQTYATIGIEGLAPYEFETEAALFVSTRGDVLARTEGWYDQRLTQRLVLQPRIELNFAAQDVPRDRIGDGLSTAELGVRLRYEITRRLAPYVGVSYEAKVGRTADYARADGERAHSTSIVTGIRFWL